MKPAVRHVAVVTLVVLAWSAIVVGFSTSMGARPLRIYDWGPPVFAGLITVATMLFDRSRRRG